MFLKFENFPLSIKFALSIKFSLYKIFPSIKLFLSKDKDKIIENSSHRPILFSSAEQDI